MNTLSVRSAGFSPSIEVIRGVNQNRLKPALQTSTSLSPWLLLSVLILVAVRSLLAAETRPNFVIMIADDMAWEDCGPYGNRAVRTPNIDRLAREGMRFERAFLTCSSCSPSRASI